jgi:hypothetical protein
MSDETGRLINDDMADLEANFNRLAETLVGRPDDEIREALTRFWADSLDEVDDDVSDWIEDDTASLANGELVALDVRRIDR